MLSISESLLKEEQLRDPFLDVVCFDAIFGAEAGWLDRSSKEQVIELVVKSCKGDTASGPNDFPLAFSQYCWSAVKHDVFMVCQEFHDHYFFERSLNATFISLIPKKPRAVDLKHFRPISFVGRLYKILSKLLGNRLKAILGNFISFLECFYAWQTNH